MTSYLFTAPMCSTAFGVKRTCSWLHEATVATLMTHRDLASRIHVRNAAGSGQTRTDANDPERSSAPNQDCESVAGKIVSSGHRAFQVAAFVS
jgi:hypothetical protein